MDTPYRPDPMRDLEAADRSVAARALFADHWPDLAGVIHRYNVAQPPNLRLGSWCQEGQHDKCPPNGVQVVVAFDWRCYCLCHQRPQELRTLTPGGNDGFTGRGPFADKPPRGIR